MTKIDHLGTPRTDNMILARTPEVFQSQYELPVVRADFARQLERELNAAATPTPDAVKLLNEIKECAEGVVRNLREDIAPELRENIWVATAACHAVVILQDLPVLTAQQAEHAAVVTRLEMERDVARASRRWNIEETKDGFRLCRGEHDKSDSCSFVEYVPLADLSAARAEVERWTKLTEDANRRYDTLMAESQPEIVSLRAQLTALRERAEADSKRLLNVARGCLDYCGGHRDKDLETYHHGIQTVINALEAAAKRDPNDTQVNALERMGRAVAAKQEES